MIWKVFYVLLYCNFKLFYKKSMIYAICPCVNIYMGKCHISFAFFQYNFMGVLYLGIFAIIRVILNSLIRPQCYSYSRYPWKWDSIVYIICWCNNIRQSQIIFSRSREICASYFAVGTLPSTSNQQKCPHPTNRRTFQSQACADAAWCTNQAMLKIIYSEIMEPHYVKDRKPCMFFKSMYFNAMWAYTRKELLLPPSYQVYSV